MSIVVPFVGLWADLDAYSTSNLFINTTRLGPVHLVHQEVNNASAAAVVTIPPPPSVVVVHKRHSRV